MGNKTTHETNNLLFSINNLTFSFTVQINIYCAKKKVKSNYLFSNKYL